MKSGIVLFAHGSRDPEWAAPFCAIEAKLAAARPESVVALAFLDMMQPAFAEALDRLVEQSCENITVAPLFMARGAHLARDLVKLVEAARKKHPSIEISVLPAAGEVASVADAIATWIAAST